MQQKALVFLTRPSLGRSIDRSIDRVTQSLPTLPFFAASPAHTSHAAVVDHYLGRPGGIANPIFIHLPVALAGWLYARHSRLCGFKRSAPISICNCRPIDRTFERNEHFDFPSNRNIPAKYGPPSTIPKIGFGTQAGEFFRQSPSASVGSFLGP